MKLIAAMSGGVDSAVAAARAVDAGHEVTGVHLALASNPQKYRSGARGCCTIEDSHDARRAADVVGIPFYIWDMAEEFHQGVVENFLSEYASGRTPNPCLRCNEKIKFAAVLDRAQAMGFDGVVTGHYAITREGSMGKTLHRAIDNSKDQSYVLAVLTIEQIAGAMFPLGDTEKVDIRKEAAERGLYVANKPDSHVLKPEFQFQVGPLFCAHSASLQLGLILKMKGVPCKNFERYRYGRVLMPRSLSRQFGQWVE